MHEKKSLAVEGRRQIHDIVKALTPWPGLTPISLPCRRVAR